MKKIKWRYEKAYETRTKSVMKFIDYYGGEDGK